ncbi:hypothetical protein TNCV_4269511 [Trichonephila clavipes]|nr:hypothetical protein TNCV_4269511 [Trichonephila clavipes]
MSKTDTLMQGWADFSRVLLNYSRCCSPPNVVGHQSKSPPGRSRGPSTSCVIFWIINPWDSDEPIEMIVLPYLSV